MEALVASAIGLMTAAGIYLILRLRTFPVVLGMSLLSYAVNVFLFVLPKITVTRAGLTGMWTDWPLPANPVAELAWR